jgi:hypothetical protein
VTDPRPQAPDEQLVDKELDTTAVVQMMQTLVKGLRAVQLYLPNNPVYQRAVENLKREFGAVWEECLELDLTVQETELVWSGEPVLSQPNKSDSIAWVLFKDGIRSITLVPGVEDAEIVTFLDVIHKARTLPAEAPDDLLTLLWDQDFQKIRYHAVELAMDEIPTIAKDGAESGMGAVPAPSPEAITRQVAEDATAEAKPAQEAEGEAQPGIVKVEDFDSTLYFLDESEINYLKGEIDREYKQDLRENVLAMLFDLLELQTYSTVRAELISILENFIPYLLAGGDFKSVAYVLREIRVLLERAREVLPEHRDMLQGVPAKLSEADTLGQLLQSLDEALVHPTEEELSDLFRELKPEALEAILGWLPKLTNERVRGLLDGSAQRLAQAHPEVMTNALKTPDEVILLEALRLVSMTKLPPAVPALGALIVKGSSQVKRAAVEALAVIGTPGAMQQLERAIEDTDRDVRVAAVRAMAAQGYRGAFDAIEGAISGRTMKDADLTEKTVFFEAYGTLAGESGINTLQPMLQTKGFMRRKQDSQTRACAAMALGKIGTEAAKKALKEAASDKDPLVRNAVTKALREMR